MQELTTRLHSTHTLLGELALVMVPRNHTGKVCRCAEDKRQD